MAVFRAFALSGTLAANWAPRGPTSARQVSGFPDFVTDAARPQNDANPPLRAL